MNVYKGQRAIWGRTFMATILAAFSARPGAALVVAGKLRLSNANPFNPTPDSTVASLAANEVTYSGYTAGGYATTFVGPVNFNPLEPGLIVVQNFLAVVAGPFVPDTAYGWWIDDGVNLIAAEPFAGGASAAFSSPGDWLDLVASMPFPLQVSV
jgi:hypothetical protein